MNSVFGYISKIECELLANEANNVIGGTIVELGSYLGKSTCVLAENAGMDTIIYAIDLWKNINMGNEKERDTYDEFIKNIEIYKDIIVVIKSDTSIAAKDFNKKIDLLFIDADHSYEGCMADICSWYPLVKDGGIILLHDYTEKGCGVGRAVAEYFWNKNIKNTNIIASTMRIQK